MIVGHSDLVEITVGSWGVSKVGTLAVLTEVPGINEDKIHKCLIHLSIRYLRSTYNVRNTKHLLDHG